MVGGGDRRGVKQPLPEDKEGEPRPCQRAHLPVVRPRVAVHAHVAPAAPRVLTHHVGAEEPLQGRRRGRGCGELGFSSWSRRYQVRGVGVRVGLGFKV